MTYRVHAKSISYVYLDVEADSEEQALEIADRADGGEFTDSGFGDWVMDLVELIDGNETT